MDDLKPAMQHISDGQRERAVKELADVLAANPGNADAWWLLATLLDDPVQQADCLRRVLKLDPANERAARALADLLSDPKQDPSAYPPDFQKAIDYMRVQRGLAPPPQKDDPPWFKAMMNVLDPESGGLRFSFPKDNKRRLGPLRPEDAFELLEPEGEQTACSNCKATISVDEKKCPWCGHAL